MKIFACILALALAPQLAVARDAEKLPNGAFFVTAWMVTVSHSPPAIHSARAYAWANNGINLAIDQLNNDATPQCFIVPFYSGYQIIVLSVRPLSDDDRTALHKLVDEQLKKAVKKDLSTPQ